MEINLTVDEAKRLAKKWGVKDFVAPDEIIEAYTEGKKMGVERYVDELKKERQQKLLYAMRISSETIEKLEQQLKIKIQTAHLRQSILDEKCIYKTLIVIEESEYLDDKVKDAYQILIKTEQKLRKENVLNIDFSFLPNKQLNNELLYTDGYFYHYDKSKTGRAQ